MDEREANAIADGLLDAARAQRAKRTARMSRFAGAGLRFQTGGVTLIGAGIGFWASRGYGVAPEWCVVVAIVCGLIAAVAWAPVRWHL